MMRATVIQERLRVGSMKTLRDLLLEMTPVNCEPSPTPGKQLCGFNSHYSSTTDKTHENICLMGEQR